MSRKIQLIGIGILILLAVGAFFFWNPGFFSKSDEPSTDRKPTADKVFALSLADIHGTNVQLEDFKGKNVIINAWATWCPYCLEELPSFRDVAGEYGDTISVIAINRQESLDTARSYLERTGIGGRVTYLLDQDDSLYKAIQGFSMPETIFIDKEGVIRFHKRGPMEKEEIRRRAQEIFGI